MYFYQAQWWDEGNQFGELRLTRQEAIDDLVEMGCPIEKLVEGHHGLMYVPNSGFGISVTRV